MAATLLFGVSPARADEAVLDQARIAYQNVEYERALALIAEALPGLSETHRIVEALELRVTIQISVGRSPAAENSYVELLKVKPDYEPPATASPKLVAVFQSAKQRAEAETQARPTPTETPPPLQPPNAEEDVGDVSRAPPLYMQPWLWGVAAIVVAGSIGVGVWIGTRPPAQPHSDLPIVRF